MLELFRRFIGLQVRGGWIPEGRALRLGALPEGLASFHGGSLEDADFNNVHVGFRLAPH